MNEYICTCTSAVECSKGNGCCIGCEEAEDVGYGCRGICDRYDEYEFAVECPHCSVIDDGK